MNDYFVCPNCGAELALNALACRECGSDENTGWSDETMYDGLDLPSDFDDADQPSKSFFQNKYILYFVIFFTVLAFLLFYLW
ncbi:MAG: zinc-ribbon domain-containing protein [Candidatus Anammoxibacter sp.]